jgi:membrane peptidoglycan carboxypeptidase
VKNLLEQQYGLPIVERGGLSVITSLDLKTQNMAQSVVTNEVNKAGYLNFTNGAALVTNPKNGDILAMVGGKDYYDQQGGNYNVTTALRQPGSTIKVITYSAALMNGFTAASVIPDTPVSFKIPGSAPYSPVNYDGKFHGNVTLRTALANSINVPAVKALNQVGIATMVDLAKHMGISTWGEPNQYGLALTLGAAEVKMTDMAQVYGTLANQGKKVELNPFLKVTDSNGNVLQEKKDIVSTQVLPPNVTYIIDNILADNNARQMEFGANSPLNIPGHTVSVKTGTTDNKRDNWTIGFTPNVLVAVWVGNNNNAPMNPILASGITGAAPIWHNIMSTLLSKSDKTSETYPLPSDLVVKPCNGREEYFVPGTDSLANCHPLSINNRIPTLGR